MARNLSQLFFNYDVPPPQPGQIEYATKEYVDSVTTGIEFAADGRAYVNGQPVEIERLEYSAGIQYAADYEPQYTTGSLINDGIVMAKLNHLQFEIDPNLLKRIENIEKKVFGEYQAQKIKNKTDGSLEFENDVSLFFQHDLNRKSWQKIFNELNIDISKEELLKISNKFLAPKEKES